MKRAIIDGNMVILGVFMGAISWGIVSLVSDQFEPFDSDIGFYVGQFIVSAVALGIGYRCGILEVCLFVVGAYIGINGYAYLCGGTEQKAWVFLSLVTTISLIIFPTLFGFLGRLLRFFYSKFR